MKLRQSLITGSIILAAGAYKTYKDYKSVENYDKKKTLIRDVISLGAASASVFAADYFILRKLKSNRLQAFSENISGKFLNSNFYKNIVKKWPKLQMKPLKMETLSDVVASAIKDVVLSISAAAAGITAGVITDRVFKNSKQNKLEKEQEQKIETHINDDFSNRINKLVDNRIVHTVANENTKDLLLNTVRVFEMAGFVFNPFDKTGVILSGIDMSKNKNFKKVLEQTASGIVAGAMIPAFVVSISNTLSRTKRLFIKLPVLAAGFYLGDFLGRMASKYMTREVNKTVDQTIA